MVCSDLNLPHSTRRFKDRTQATRDGAPPVELIDGDRLCDLLKQFRLSVEVRERIEQDVTVNPGFFDEYQ
jgi:restriction system protein